VAVAGNDDWPEHRRLIRGRGVREIHTRPLRIGRFLVVGLEGAPRVHVPDVDIGHLLWEEEAIARHLRRRVSGWRGVVIVVSHAPPHGCLDGAVRFSESGEPRSIGSRALREFVERDRRVRLVICGHVHREGGRNERLGAARVMNVASHDDDRREPVVAAVVSVRLSGEVVVEPVRIPVLERPGMRDVWGVGWKYEQRLKSAGFRTLEDLARADPKSLAGAIGWRQERRCAHWVAHANSLLDGHPRLLKHPAVPGPPRVYVDVETDRLGRYCWLVSAATDDGVCGQFMSEWGETGEAAMLEQFLDWLGQFEGLPVLVYGSTEKGMLPRRLKERGLPVPGALERAVNVYTECFARLALVLPRRSYELKEVAGLAGFRLRHPDLSGELAASLYEEAVARRNYEDLKRLREYGEDDVLALRHFVQWLDRNGWTG
jgi:predicted flap endonuclease-1-like 5' DNA nuclease